MPAHNRAGRASRPNRGQAFREEGLLEGSSFPISRSLTTPSLPPVPRLVKIRKSWVLMRMLGLISWPAFWTFLSWEMA